MALRTAKQGNKKPVSDGAQPLTGIYGLSGWD